MLRGLMPLAAGVVLACAVSATSTVSAIPAVLAQVAPLQHPADIRLGSCAALGEVVVPLSAIVVPPGELQGQDGATPVEQSVTEIAMPLTDLLATGHAITVHPSPEQVGTPVACGEIGGALASDGTLAVGLNAMNGAKVSGVASFAPVPESHATLVTILIVDERAGRRAANREDAAANTGAAGEPGAVGSGGATDAAAAPDVAPAPAPAAANTPDIPAATAGLDGTTTISADGPGAKPGKPERDREGKRAEREDDAAAPEAEDAGRGGQDGKADDAAE